MAGPAVNPAVFSARQAQPLEQMMGDAKSAIEDLFGKTDPKDLPAWARAAVENKERIRGLAARLFAPNTEGEELLEALCDVVMRRPFVAPALGVPADQAARYADQREGQAQTIFILLAWIAEGRSEQPPQREGESHAQNVRKRRKPAKPDDRPADDGAGQGRRRRRRR
jgi:hypothetical protein